MKNCDDITGVKIPYMQYKTDYKIIHSCICKYLAFRVLKGEIRLKWRQWYDIEKIFIFFLFGFHPFSEGWFCTWCIHTWADLTLWGW